MQRHGGARECGISKALQRVLLFVLRQGMTWVTATSLQGLGDPTGDAGLHPEEKQSLKCTDPGTAWPDRHFRERTLAAVSTHPNIPFPDEETKGSRRVLPCLRLAEWSRCPAAVQGSFSLPPAPVMNAVTALPEHSTQAAEALQDAPAQTCMQLSAQAPGES